MNSTNTIICLLGLALSSWSCVRESVTDCPVVVAVRDKNYDNAAEAGVSLLDENLPLLSYINSLVLRNRVVDTGGGMVYDETLLSGERVHTIDASRFSPNVNRMTAIGNSPGARQYTTGQEAVTLHPDGLEGEDIYTGYDDITYPPAVEDTIWLYRTKGLLIVEPVNMPAETRSVEISVSGLYATADRGTDGLPLYGGTVSVVKSFDTASTGAGARFSTMLSPSEAGSLSPLKIVFAFTDGTDDSLALDIAIRRNHITLVRPEYNPTLRTWSIHVMVDGNWIKIENLNITEYE